MKHYFLAILLIFVSLQSFSQSRGKPAEYKIVTFAGNGTAGYKNGTGSSAMLNQPGGMCIDAYGNLYLGESGNHVVRKITPGGKVSLLAGSLVKGHRDGASIWARFSDPGGLCVSKSGIIYLCDEGNSCIKKIDKSGKVTTIAGSQNKGYTNGSAKDARFSSPIDIAVDSKGNLFIVDYENYVIRKITPSGKVSTFAGSGKVSGFVDGIGTSAKFSSMLAIAIDANDNLYVADAGNKAIRKISPSGVVTTICNRSFSGYTKEGFVPNLSFQFSGFGIAAGITVDKEGWVYVADGGTNVVVRFHPKKKIVKHVAGSGQKGFINGDPNKAAFNVLVDIEVNAQGDVFICDSRNNCVRKFKKIEIEEEETKDSVIVKANPNIIAINGQVIDLEKNFGLSSKFVIENVQTKQKHVYQSAKSGYFSIKLFKGKYKIYTNRKDYLPFATEIEVKDKVPFLKIGLDKIKKDKKITFSSIQFKPSSYKLQEFSYEYLEKVAEFMKNNPNVKIQVNGHTDKGAGYDYNLKLSKNRAKTVVEYLVALGITPSRLTYKGFGNTKPIASNSTAEGRKKNRRIEFEIISK